MNMKKNKLKYNYIYLIYDIKEERVNKIFKICKKYLEHYQNPVFKGEISESNILKLKNEINKIINKDEDSILILYCSELLTLAANTVLSGREISDIPLRS